MLQHFSTQGFPDCDTLNALLPDGLCSHGGHAIRFVKSTELDDTAYEQRIYTSGQVSTRADNWHDLFNALVWTRFPHIKVAMNALHQRGSSQSSPGSRGHLRDALTLFDESGVIVFSDRLEYLTALSKREWPVAFQQLSSHWGKELQVAITGHAILEKYLAPYKSMTAKALLIQLDSNAMNMDAQTRLEFLDQQIAEQFLAGNLLTTPACLAPLPLAGIPGWWSDTVQDDAFYSDLQVFRPAPKDLKPAAIYHLI